MQVRCRKAFGYSKPGDVAEVPDGAAVDPEHWEPVAAPPPPAVAPVTPAVPPAAAITPKEGM
jgi:hypothetical protein